VSAHRGGRAEERPGDRQAVVALFHSGLIPRDAVQARGPRLRTSGANIQFAILKKTVHIKLLSFWRRESYRAPTFSTTCRQALFVAAAEVSSQNSGPG